eukprot:m.57668 g.57668  ORF g.57668 m.57668 type:complete len:291 (+) comp11123_c0_seq3:219-1091(+)
MERGGRRPGPVVPPPPAVMMLPSAAPIQTDNRDSSKSKELLTPHQKRIIAALLAEFLGTLLFVLLAVGIQANELKRSNDVNTDNSDLRYPTDTTIMAGLAHGLTYATLISMFESISGGHFNPAITVAAVVGRRIGMLPGAMYIVVQITGAVCGSAIYDAMSGSEDYGQLGVTKLNTDLNTGSIFGAELLATLFVTLLWFFMLDLTMAPCGMTKNLTGPLYIGLAYFIAASFTSRWDRVGLNPARAFGPAAVSGDWDHHWVYWMGPVIGAMGGTLLFELFMWLRTADVEGL